MECFNIFMKTISEALTDCLRERGGKGTLSLHFAKRNDKFNIWDFRFTLLWVRPSVTKSVFTYQESITCSYDKHDEAKMRMVKNLLKELFSKQDEIWNLISTSPD